MVYTRTDIHRSSTCLVVVSSTSHSQTSSFVLDTSGPYSFSLSLRERTMMIGTGRRFSTYHSILIVMGAVFTSCTRAAYWKVGLPFVGHDKYRFSTAAPPRYNPVTRLRLALHQPSYTLPLPIRFPPILGLASTPILVIRWILPRLGTLASKKIETFELDIYDFSFFPQFFFFYSSAFYSSDHRFEAVTVFDHRLRRM